jgi:hypothetical protein
MPGIPGDTTTCPHRQCMNNPHGILSCRSDRNRMFIPGLPRNAMEVTDWQPGSGSGISG